MVINNGLAERGSKIKLSNKLSKEILSQYESVDNVLFSVEATGTAVNYQCQIKKNNTWVDINGAVGPKLKADEIKVEDDGKVFRCKIYNTAGTVYSNECVLTVVKPKSVPTITVQPSDKVISAKSSGEQLTEKVAKLLLIHSIKLVCIKKRERFCSLFYFCIKKRGSI